MASVASHGRSWPKIADPATKTFAPAAAATRRGRLVDATVDLDVDPVGQAPLDQRPPDLSDLRQHLRHERLPAEAREDGHAEHQVDLVEVRLDRVERRVRVRRQAGPQAERSQLRQQLAGPADLDVDGATVRPGVPERLEVVTRVRHHQVAVEEHPRVLAQRRDDRRPDRQVRHEVAVHDVDVQPVRGRRHLADRLGQAAEVRREDRRRHLHLAGDAGVGSHDPSLRSNRSAPSRGCG